MDRNTLLSYMPDYYNNSAVIDNINNANTLEISKIDNKLNNISNQCLISTSSTDLRRWENEYGIITNTEKSISERISRVLAKKLSKGITNTEKLKLMAQTFINDVDVIRHDSEYYFDIKLLSYQGFPYALDGLYEAIDEIKPCHLGSKYNLVSRVNSKLYIKSACINGQKTTVYPWQAKTLQSKAQISISPGVNRGSNTITIYPKGGI